MGSQLLQAFDATKVDPTQGVGNLPVGKHPVIIEASEVKPNKDGTGGFLQLTLRVIDYPAIPTTHVGATGAHRLNLYHSNQQTVEIAHKQLSALCHVTGVYNVTDAAQLHNIPFIVEVEPQKDPQYTAVKRVLDISGNEPHRAGQGTRPAQAQTPAPAQQPAWGQPAQAQQPAQAPAQAQAPAWGQPTAAQAQPQPNGAPAWGGQPQGGNPPWQR